MYKRKINSGFKGEKQKHYRCSPPVHSTSDFHHKNVTILSLINSKIEGRIESEFACLYWEFYTDKNYFLFQGKVFFVHEIYIVAWFYLI